MLQQAPAATVQVRGVLGPDGEGTIDDVVTAARDLARGNMGQPVDVLNLSLGCYGDPDDRTTFANLFAELAGINPNLVVVAAAGNLVNGIRGDFYPAALADHTKVVSVGAATDQTATTLAPWSNSGPWLTFLADGTGLISTFLKFPTNAPPHPLGRWAQWGGSSFATAVTSGLIAAAMAPGDGTHRLGPEAVQVLLKRQDPARAGSAADREVPAGPVTGSREAQARIQGVMTRGRPARVQRMPTGPRGRGRTKKRPSASRSMPRSGPTGPTNSTRTPAGGTTCPKSASGVSSHSTRRSSS